MFDRSACAKVRVAAEPHIDLPVLVMLGALLRDAVLKRHTVKPQEREHLEAIAVVG
jgi:hypothetical protein